LALVKEIGSRLLGTYVKTIYSLGEAQIIRFGKSGGRDVWLMASPRHGVWVSEKVSERAETTEFTSRLRRELERAKFAGAAQLDLDRIFELRLGEGESTRRLIVELMPPGNVVVADGDGKILLVEREVRSPRRRVTRGVIYAPPAQGRLNPAVVQAEDVKKMTDAEKTVGNAIGKHVSIPRKYVAEALLRLSLREEAPSTSLKGMESQVARVLRGMVEESRDNSVPCLCETKAGDDIFAIRPRAFSVRRESPTLSGLCDDLLLPEVVKAAEPGPSAQDAKRRELEATLSRLKSEKEKLLAEASKTRSSAATASSTVSVAGVRKLLQGAGLVTREEVSSAAAAASLLYDRAKDQERKAADVEAAIRRLERKVPGVKERRPTGRKELPRRGQEWYEKFRWFRTTGGKLAIGGRDAQSNAIIIRRHLQDDDVVYHADLFGSPFFVLKGGKEQSEEEVREMAQATVAYSSAWKTGLGSADAYWVNPSQVGAAAPSGEYLARGSFAIRGKKNFVPKNLVELAVGLDESGRVVAGPEVALKQNSLLYVVVRPHREKGSETAKRVKKDLESLAGDGRKAVVSVDDILRALPAGGGKVVRTFSGRR
jgi:predicted ribosome quality control (RQC) complex YloA/Tae2 family protein